MNTVMSRRRGLAMLGGAFALAGSASLPTFAQTKKYMFAYAGAADKIPFVAAVGQSVQAAAQQRGIELVYMDNEADAAHAVQNARNVASRKPDLFIEYNLVADSNGQVASICAEANVPIVAVQYPCGSAPLFVIKNRDCGFASAKAIAEAAKAKWGPSNVNKAIVVNFSEGGAQQLERSEGAKAAISAILPKTQIVDVSDKNDTAVARQLVADALTTAPNQKLIIWVHVDSFALAALSAVRGAGRENDVLIASIGGDRSVFPELRKSDSPYVGTLGLSPEDWGAQLCDLGLRVVRGQKVPAVSNPSRIEFLSRANIDKLYPQDKA
jgi:ribose transport system substrate-binding protein